MTFTDFEPFSGLPKAAQWCVLVAISVTVTALLRMVQLPAALMFGPLIGGIILEVGGARLKVPRVPYRFAQAVIGCMIARVFTSEIVAGFRQHWPLFITVVLAIIAASCLLGFVVSKLGIFPGTTAVWGLLPGAASAMIVMAEDFGADARLVAFMQYFRVVLVAVTASVVARLWIHVSGGAPATLWFPQIHGLAFAETLALVFVGVVFGHRSRIPVGTLLLPLFLGAALRLGGWIDLQLPPWFLAGSYLLIGWNTGLRFTRKILAQAARAIPQTILTTTAIIAFCGLLACVLVRVAGIDALTAYLATSPGGADSVAIIAAGSKVDLPFVMTLQISRALLVLLIGPPVSRWIAGLLESRDTAAPEMGQP